MFCETFWVFSGGNQNFLKTRIRSALVILEIPFVIIVINNLSSLLIYAVSSLLQNSLGQFQCVIQKPIQSAKKIPIFSKQFRRRRQCAMFTAFSPCIIRLRSRTLLGVSKISFICKCMQMSSP